MAGSYVDVPLALATQPKTGACIAQHYWIARQVDGEWRIVWYDFGKNDGGMPEMAPMANSSENVATRIRDGKFKDYEVKYVEVVYESSVGAFIKEQRSKK